jgi:hypothetical protein
MSLVERKGQVRSFHFRVANVTAETVKPIIAEVLSTDSHFRTDESGIYWKIGFRYNYRIALGFNDTARAELAIKGIAGKRLTYRQPRSQAEEAGAT